MKRIMLVEDSRTQAERVRLVLTAEGYEVEVAPSAEDGLRAIGERTPDLVISDVMLPGIDGFELCRRLNGAPATRHLPVILLTSRTSPADVLAGLEAGADNFIPKPYDDAHLIERVRRIFEQLELRKQQTLEMQVILTIGGRKVVVTADRQQIIELLFATFEQMGRNYEELERTSQSLRAAQAEAERANLTKSRFLSRMSHELRTPLTSIIGFAQILDAASIADREREYARTILRAGHHLLELINELLDIGRIEADEIAVALEPVHAAEMHRDILEMIRPLAADRGVTIEDSPPADDMAVVADRQRLRQILLNLASNAVKYNRDSGTMRVTWSAIDGRVTVEVSDTGSGIAPNDLDRLFIPFDRIDADNEVPGTGLGLAISKRLAELMGGNLSVRSELGAGSTFTVVLPAAPTG